MSEPDWVLMNKHISDLEAEIARLRIVAAGCPEHPAYRGKRKPRRTDCLCGAVYAALHPSEERDRYREALTASHSFAPTTFGGDTCIHCGLDIRDPVHPGIRQEVDNPTPNTDLSPDTSSNPQGDAS